MPDYIRIFVSTLPKIRPTEIARLLRGSSARYFFQHHPELKRWELGGHLWNPSYYIGTVGHVSAETMQRHGNRKPGYVFRRSGRFEWYLEWKNHRAGNRKLS